MAVRQTAFLIRTIGAVGPAHERRELVADYFAGMPNAG